MIGSRLGKYRVLGLIGEGGMGAVYKAIHEGLDRMVAIKVLHARFASRNDMMTRFQNEARAANLVKHPSLVEIYDTDSLPDGSIYLVMELLDGEALSSLIERRKSKLPLKRVLRITWQLADAMAAVHSKNIVHRDLKPSNVMLVRDSVVPGGERVKLLDFGIAKLAVENAKGHAKTATGAMLGTIFYVAPEQCQNAGTVDGKADVYSLGGVLFELATGSLPFDGENEIQIILQHLQAPPPKAVSVAPDVPVELSALIERMMAKDRAARPTMAEVAAELQRIESSLSLPEPPADDPPRVKLEELPTAALTVPQATPEDALAFTNVRLVKDGPNGRDGKGPSGTPRERSFSGLATDPSGEEHPHFREASDKKRRRSTLGWSGGLIGGIALVLGTGYYIKRAAQPNPVQPVVSAPQPVPQIKEIRWSLNSVPPEAEVASTTDGTVLGKTPYVRQGPAPKGPLSVVLRKAGFVEQRLLLPEDRDFEDTVALKSILPPAPPPQPAANKPPKGKRRPDPPPQKVVQPVTPPPPQPTPHPVVSPQLAVPRVTPPRLVAPDKKP